MRFSTRYALALVGAMGLMVAAESAQAIDLNGKGSSAGRNFAGDTPGKVCDPGTPATFFYQWQGATANPGSDPTLPSARTEWRCTVAGAPGTTILRYHGTNSLDGFASLNSTNVLLNTAGYLNTASGCIVNPTGTNPRALSGHPTVTVMQCPASPALLTNLPIHYGASDVQGASFTQSAFGSGVVPPVIAAGVDLTTLPIITVPFGVAVGPGVLQGAGPAQLDNLSISDLQQILAGTVTDWRTIGNTTDEAGHTAITVCQRTVGSGTLATLDQTIMRKGPRAINPTRNPAAGAPALGAPGNLNNAGSSDMVNCLNNAGGVNPNTRMSIGYVDSDSLPLLPGFHFVKINGFEVFDHNNATLTSARLKDLRCGDYPYWANWNMVVRTNGVDGLTITGGGGTVPAGTDAVLDTYINAAQVNNPVPGFWVLQSEMFTSKNADQGPQAMLPGGQTFCQKAN